MLIAEFADDEAELTGDHAVHDVLDHLLCAARIAVHMDGEHGVMLRILFENGCAAVDDGRCGLSPAARVTHDAVLETGISDDLHGINIGGLPCGIICAALPLVCDVDDNGVLMAGERGFQLCEILRGIQQRLCIVFAGCVVNLKDSDELVCFADLDEICDLASGILVILVAVAEDDTDGIRAVICDLFQCRIDIILPLEPSVCVVRAAHDERIAVRIAELRAVDIEAVLRLDCRGCTAAELQIGDLDRAADRRIGRGGDHHIDAVDLVEIRNRADSIIECPFLAGEIIAQILRGARVDRCVGVGLMPVPVAAGAECYAEGHGAAAGIRDSHRELGVIRPVPAGAVLRAEARDVLLVVGLVEGDGCLAAAVLHGNGRLLIAVGLFPAVAAGTVGCGCVDARDGRERCGGHGERGQRCVKLVFLHFHLFEPLFFCPQMRHFMKQLRSAASVFIIQSICGTVKPFRRISAKKRKKPASIK